MQAVRVRFDRIFDVARYGGGEAHTYFGFQSAHMKQCGARVEGLPELAEGMEVTAVLKYAGDWTSVLGWYDHSNGKIAVGGMYNALMVSILGTALTILTAYEAFHKNPEIWLLDIFFLAIAIGGISALSNRIKAKRFLKSLAGTSTPPPDVGD